MSPEQTAFAPAPDLRWLYIDFNSYFASVEQQLRPNLRGRPVAVVPVETDATCAIAASYEAKAYGIKTGTPIYEARKMCPDLVCVLARHELYVEFHERILTEIDHHIPVSKVCSIDEMACALMKNERSMQRVAEIADSIKAGLAKNIGEYVRCSIGAAPSKYLAKIATDLKKPDGFTILQAADLPQSLTVLSLRDLPGIGANMEKRLLAAGINDMHGLLRLSPRHLRAVWGSIWGEKMWYYLRGYDLPDPETERRSVGHSHVLAPELRPASQAALVARRLVMKAAARLRRIGYHAGGLVLSVRVENGSRLAFEAPCHAAQDSFTFLQLLDGMWEEMLRHAPQPSSRLRLKKVSVVLQALVEGAQVNRQGDLFAPTASQEQKKKSEKNDKISNAIDEINRKFGRDSVLLGMTAGQGRGFTGTKIAFTRIPDAEEFWE